MATPISSVNQSNLWRLSGGALRRRCRWLERFRLGRLPAASPQD
ncbi:hypothetical protein SynA1524_00819 [Synechococcus sp. A15-24]|nr:hypothetical protein SynA1524_00819 [Synechococcus sp. A15-24]